MPCCAMSGSAHPSTMSVLAACVAKVEYAAPSSPRLNLQGG